MILSLGIVLFCIGAVVSWASVLTTLAIASWQLLRTDRVRLPGITLGVGAAGLVLTALSIPVLILGYSMETS